MNISSSTARPRRYLNADSLLSVLRNRFETLIDSRRECSVAFPLPDVLMAAFAMFSLKDPSLLAFQARAPQQSLLGMYGIKNIPSDTQMREILDPVDYSELHECFADLFFEFQRGGELKRFQFLDGHYLLAIDGTGYFCSSKISCPSCLQRQSNSGVTQYAHQAVVAVIVHPQSREVIPLAMEPIIKQDGQDKNDCERNATRRLLQRVRQQHPKLKLIVVEDGLSSNAPHIHDLENLGFSYILGAKPGDHQHLYDAVVQAGDEDRVHSVSMSNIDGKQTRRETMWVKNLPLNASNTDLRVNFVQQFEFLRSGEIINRFGWVTNLKITRERVIQIAAGGRCRWKIENETFNTLKNQGYQFEHNYGHGVKNLSTVLAVLMLLAFLVDQIQQACCPLFRKAMSMHRTRKQFWELLRCSVVCFVFKSFQQLYRAMIAGQTINSCIPNTS